MGVVGGELYPRFRKWFVAALNTDVSLERGESEADALERKTIMILRRLHEFAIDCLENDNFKQREPELDVQSSKARVKPLMRPPGASSWRCSRCSFANSAGSNNCTACCLV